MVKNSIRIVFLVFLTTALFSCQFGRSAWHGKAGLDDYKKFANRELYANTTENFKFYNSDTTKINPDLNWIIQKYNWLIETILYEKYFDDYSRASVIPSFSMAKSFTSILIGCAIEDGLIESIDEPVTTYVPELKKHGFDKVSIKHLLQMTSGIDFNENYSNPFADVAKLYYGRNLRKQVGRFKLKSKPGEAFHYNSGDSQLLGLILERALDNRSITQYFQEKIWSPLGMEYNGSWSLDSQKNGLEKTYCCLNATAIDFAKIGRLYLNKGNWNGQQIVSEQWVNESTKIDTSDGSIDYYQYHWWVSGERFEAVGIMGQLLYVHPSKELIIVRLGKERKNIRWDLISDAIALSFD